MGQKQKQNREQQRPVTTTATFIRSKNTTLKSTLEAGSISTIAKQETRLNEWDLQASIEKGAEQVLPVALLLGMLACAGSLATSAAMMGMHFPVHTVLCLANRTSPTANTTATPHCYPNFFTTTWIMIFVASALSFLFYAFLCLQQRELRLRQSIAMLGSFTTMFLWLSTICIGFLPTQVAFDSMNGSGNTPRVCAYGMLTSSIFNYQVAHKKIRLDMASAILENSTSPSNDASQLVWVIGGSSGGSKRIGNGTSGGVVASIYRANGDANRFWYKLGNQPAVNSSAETQTTRNSIMRVPRRGRYQTAQYKEDIQANKGAGQTAPIESLAVALRAEPTPIHIWNMYDSSDFYKQETQWAMSATVFVSLSL